jgi:hypothetical protein
MEMIPSTAGIELNKWEEGQSVQRTNFIIKIRQRGAVKKVG